MSTVNKSLFISDLASAEANDCCYNPPIQRTPSSEALFQRQMALLQTSQESAPQGILTTSIIDDYTHPLSGALAPLLPSPPSAPIASQQDMETTLIPTSTETREQEKIEYPSLPAIPERQSPKSSAWKISSYITSFIPGFYKRAPHVTAQPAPAASSSSPAPAASSSSAPASHSLNPADAATTVLPKATDPIKEIQPSAALTSSSAASAPVSTSNYAAYQAHITFPWDDDTLPQGSQTLYPPLEQSIASDDESHSLYPDLRTVNTPINK